MTLEFFEGFDLNTPHYVAALLGVGLSLYVMQLWAHGEVATDHPVVGQLRRTALIILALALLWSLGYADSKKWQPWPSDLLTVIAIDIFLLSTVISHIIRRHNTDLKTRA